MTQILIALFIISMTILIYLGMNYLYNYFPSPFLVPMMTTGIVLILLLISFHVSYDTYLIGGKWINSLLGPAVVALAYPLYNQRQILRKNIKPIMAGVGIGAFTGMASGALLSFLFGLNKVMILSMMPKSITAPVAMEVSSELGGIPAITVVFVLIAGLIGAIFGPILLKLFHIKSSIGKGIALGSASHALGTSKASEYGELSFSMSSVSMALTAIIGAIVGSLIPLFF
ncbi:LrgB family protein [Peribacillus psychrosaccharolyticus]|uniref:LrgB family protein n=1 Tax=Peribacillus psychrosaccharolyticus TaxID=1407 RepID=A0A974S0D8_PERPY|nr:LrgB family protein [Peribacillus psychrosaccharolyticus]MEC2056292.1 LrgB family protein [Peribacillus psychrosaccharolyticus]MED3743694.1 LrgB family protein [Peribacillus psychrosaccharolyticus]QQT00537.1 LrgB family protein [Peribacillus psychrosaccharolyticus]